MAGVVLGHVLGHPCASPSPLVTLSPQVYVVKEEQEGAGEAGGPTEFWFCDQNWFFVVTRFRKIIADYNRTQRRPSPSPSPVVRTVSNRVDGAL